MPNVHDRALSRHELARRLSRLDAIAGVRLVTLGDGAERGVRVLEFRTGSGLDFDVMVDRCMDVGAVRYRGASIGWQSPTGFRSPWLHDPEGERGLGFLRSFTGFMNTCGLDHAFFMESRAGRALRLSGPRGRGPPAPRAVSADPGAARRVRRALGGGRVRAVGRRGGDPGRDVRRRPASRPADRGAPGRERIHRGGSGREPRVRADARTCCSTTSTSAGRSSTREASSAPPSSGSCGEATRPTSNGVGYRTMPAPQPIGLRRAGPYPRGGCGPGRHGARRPRQSPSRSSVARGGPGLAFLIEYDRQASSRYSSNGRACARAGTCVGIEPSSAHPGGVPPSTRSTGCYATLTTENRAVTARASRSSRGRRRSRPSRRESTRCTRSSRRSSRNRPGSVRIRRFREPKRQENHHERNVESGLGAYPARSLQPHREGAGGERVARRRRPGGHRCRRHPCERGACPGRTGISQHRRVPRLARHGTGGHRQVPGVPHRLRATSRTTVPRGAT